MKAYIYHYHAQYNNTTGRRQIHRDGLHHRDEPLTTPEDYLILKDALAREMQLSVDEIILPGDVVITSITLIHTREGDSLNG